MDTKHRGLKLVAVTIGIFLAVDCGGQTVRPPSPRLLTSAVIEVDSDPRNADPNLLLSSESDAADLPANGGRVSRSSVDPLVSVLPGKPELVPSPLSTSAGSATPAPNFREAILPITELKGLRLAFGTGFCLDPGCRFVGTNYHVAIMAQTNKVMGEKVVRRYLASGPDDEGATLNDVRFVGPTKYALSRDLAVFELRHPLPHHHGAAYYLDDLQAGTEVDIYAYPMEDGNPFRALRQFHGRFKGPTAIGLLAFDYELSADKRIRGGASGGLVVEVKSQKIVGILNAIVEGDTVALAVPVTSLVDFVNKVQPCLGQRIFPQIRGAGELSADLYPPLVASRTDGVRHRPEETPEVRVLRSKAEFMSDNIRNFIAVQTFAWGSGDRPPAAEAAYEVRVIDGSRTFREYPHGTRVSNDPPLPSFNAMSTAGWDELPAMLGTGPRLKVDQAPDAVVVGHDIKVFRYRADAEDGLCSFKSNFDFGFFSSSRTSTVSCYGEVWTDNEINILRISLHYQLPGWWKNYQVVVTYGWLSLPDDVSRLVPLSIAAQAEHGGKVYWCRGNFVNYRVFRSQVTMAAR